MTDSPVYETIAWADFCKRVDSLLAVFPEASFAADNDGQIIMYTNVTVSNGDIA